MGGGTLAWGLAQRGIDTLVLERGEVLPQAPAVPPAPPAAPAAEPAQVNVEQLLSDPALLEGIQVPPESFVEQTSTPFNILCSTNLDEKAR
jgi:choline dehydrogenase-like flavoprotein